MKTIVFSHRKPSQGYALVTVTVFLGISLAVVGGVLQWSSTSSRLNDRNNEYFAAVEAATAATEKLLTQISIDHSDFGEDAVLAKCNSATYATMVPTPSEDPGWSEFAFSDAQGAANRIHVNRVTSRTFTNTASGRKFSARYEIKAQASSARHNIQAAVKRVIGVDATPLFDKFTHYDGVDLEIQPGPNMTVNGDVHSNQRMFLAPGAALNFQANVTASGSIQTNRHPLDPRGTNAPTSGTISTTTNGVQTGVNPINLPLNNSSSVNTVTNLASALLDMPPAGEDPNSTEGKLRQYNQAKLIVVVSNNAVSVMGRSGGPGTVANIPVTNWNLFVNTNVTIYNHREAITIKPVQIDVGALREWSGSNTILGAVNSIYVDDKRDVTTPITSTNYTFTTNTVATTSTNSPASGTYSGSITNTTTNGLVSATRPAAPPALNLITNLANITTNSAPAPGTYVGLVTTNTLSTNSPTYPSPGTYLGTVTTNTVSTNSATTPSPGTYLGTVTTNTVSTNSATAPSAGTYLGTVTPNTVSTNSLTRPSAGAYLGAITTNCNGTVQKTTADPGLNYCWPGGKVKISGKWNYYTVASYTYNKINSYTYNKINSYTFNTINGYTYNKINSYSYTKIINYTYDLPAYQYAIITGTSTNIYYTTNQVVAAQSGVQLINGATLPAGEYGMRGGLTVATPKPIYVKGNYNISADGTTMSPSTTNTANTLPAALMGDAIIVLSSRWTNSVTSLGPTAGQTTVNAAFLGGIVPTSAASYSGGLENFPRFLENWSGNNFWYNGSMVALFPSRVATAPWNNGVSYYSPPVRKWTFDRNFMTEAGLPPNSPESREISRFRLTLIQPQ